MAPLLTRKRQIEVKTEATKGTAETTALVDALVSDFTLPGPAIFQQRLGSGTTLGNQVPGTPDGPRVSTCTLTTELRIASTPLLEPAVSALFLACGAKIATATYSPTSIYATMETCTIRFFEDGRMKVLRGCMGNCTISGNSGERVFLNFEMQGVWGAPTDVALPTPTYGTEKVIKMDNSSGSFKLATVAKRIGSFEFNLGNNVVPLLDVGADGGVAHMMITDRDPTMTFDIEADTVAGHDTHGDWLAGTEQALELIVTNGTRTATIAALKFQYRDVPDGDRDGTITDDITGQCNVNAATGDDEWSIVVA